MSCKSILAIAVLACSPVLAHAAAGFILNDETTLHLTGVGQVRFDDNIRLDDSGEKSDTIFSVSPGLELLYNGGQTKAQLVASETFLFYADNSEFDSELFSGIGEVNFDSGRTKADARIGYRQMSQGNVSVRNTDQSVRHDLFDSSINADWSATAKTSLGAGVMYDRTDYIGAAYVDNEHLSLPFDAYYAYSPKVDFSLGYRFRNTWVDTAPATPPATALSYDSVDHFFNVGARGEFTPKLKGQVRIGYSTRNFDDARVDTTEQLGVSGALTYAYSAKTSFNLAVSNDFSNSAYDGTSQEVFSTRVGGLFEFTPQWSAQVGLSYENTQYAEVTTGTSTFRRKDEFFVGDATLVYAMNESVSLQGSYVYRTNSSKYGPSFNNNILSLGISLRY